MRRPSLRLHALWVGLLAVSLCGCVRGVRPEEREPGPIDTGVPVRFATAQEGAPRLTWDFGDGSAPIESATGEHVFNRAGTYTVRASSAGEERLRTSVVVVPRAVVRAIPARAEAALYVPHVQRDLAPTVDFLERLMGPALLQRLLRGAPYLSVALEQLAEDARGEGAIDAREGLGLFLYPGFDGAVGLVGVRDESTALTRMLELLEAEGGIGRMDPQGLMRMEMPDGTALTLFFDRGYLFVAIPEAEREREPTELVFRKVRAQDEPALAASGVAALRREIAAGPTGGLASTPRFQTLREKVAPGSLHVFTSSGAENAEAVIEAISLSVRFGEAEATLDGFVATARPLFPSKGAPTTGLLDRAPPGAVAALQLSLPDSALLDAAAGTPGTTRRARNAAHLEKLGLGGESLLRALRGDLALLVYFDADAFLRNLIEGSQAPEPRGTVMLELGLHQADPAAQAVDRALTEIVEGSGGRVERSGGIAGGDYRFETRLFAQPLDVRIGSDRLSLTAGEPLKPGENVTAAEELRARTSPLSFSPGHLSFLFDLGELRRRLLQPRQIPGLDPERTVMLQGISSAFLDKLTPLERVFLDFAAEAGGARLAGGVQLRAGRE